MSKTYTLQCPVCESIFEDDGIKLECDSMHEPALLVTEYAAKQLYIHAQESGIYRYREWLPIHRVLPDAGRTIIYQSKRLSNLTGLSDLWIAFNGYWPERDAQLCTTTFKDLEAYTVLARLPAHSNKVLVVASAGNTAAAFASICSLTQSPCLIIIPFSGLDRLQFRESLHPCVKIIVLTGCVDYYDAILLAERIAKHDDFILEGGVKNVARRAGLGTTLLSAVEEIGHLPHYYFQAIGSGAGGIAVHEMAKKLVSDGRFGNILPQLMLSQNKPFTPIYHSWKAKQRTLLDFDRYEGKQQIQQIRAHVLSNQRPPYSIRGGVFDVLHESQGDMFSVDNDAVASALDLFQRMEGIDIDPAAGVALATLLHEVKSRRIDRDACVVLNITGGGWERKCLDHSLCAVQPALYIQDHELGQEQTVQRVSALVY